MAFVLSVRSLNNLKGVDERLVAVVKRAIQLTEYDFYVFEGVRSKERQKELFRVGATKTMNSKHIRGLAVDLYPVGKPIPWDMCKVIQKAMFEAAKELGVRIRWGGDWNMNGSSADEKFYDGPHFELLE